MERRQEAHCSVEDERLWFVVRYALSNDSESCTRCANRFEASEDAVKRLIDGHPLQMGKLTTAWSKVRIHQDIGLQRAPKSALALSRTPRKRRNLAVALR